MTLQINKTHSIRTVKQAVYFLLDWTPEFRQKNIVELDRDSLWKLTHRVSAMLKRKVNPETVARTRRQYWSDKGEDGFGKGA